MASINTIEKKELDLNNPIFVFYLNVQNKTTERGNEYIHQAIRHFDVYKNATIWFVASNKDEVVCVYGGWSKDRNSELEDLIEEINTKIEILSKSSSFEDFKINVRDWRINKLIDG
jgi:hypothetical protein